MTHANHKISFLCWNHGLQIVGPRDGRIGRGGEKLQLSVFVFLANCDSTTGKAGCPTPAHASRRTAHNTQRDASPTDPSPCVHLHHIHTHHHLRHRHLLLVQVCQLLLLRRLLRPFRGRSPRLLLLLLLLLLHHLTPLGPLSRSVRLGVGVGHCWRTSRVHGWLYTWEYYSIGFRTNHF